MNYSYFSDIVRVVNWVLLVIVIITGVITFSYALLKDHLWKKRRDGLLYIKRNLYEMTLAGKDPSEAVCQSFMASVTPRQFIDVITNRSKDAVFFNESEQSFLKKCFISPGQIKRLKRMALSSFDKWQRVEAILCLGYTAEREAVDIIRKSLFSPDRDISYFSLISLGQIKTMESARALLKFLKKNQFNSYKVISILEGFPREITKDIAELAESRNPAVRRNAALLLSRFDTSDHIKEIKKLSEDTLADVRAAACDCLASAVSAAPEAAGMLKTLLKDPAWIVRARALLGLGRLLGDAAAGDVMEMIYDPSWSVVEAVKIFMVAHIKVSLPYIKKFIASDYDVAKRYAILALEEAGYKDMPPQEGPVDGRK